MGWYVAVRAFVCVCVWVGGWVCVNMMACLDIFDFRRGEHGANFRQILHLFIVCPIV